MALNKDNNAQNQRDHTSTEEQEQEFNYYHRLPHELRHMIRQVAIKDREQSYLEARDDLTRRALPHVHINSLRPYIRPEDPSLAALAYVDREWQEDVEKQLFKQLVLFNQLVVCNQLFLYDQLVPINNDWDIPELDLLSFQQYTGGHNKYRRKYLSHLSSCFRPEEEAEVLGQCSTHSWQSFFKS